jgi:hypothetical protein
MEDLEYLVRAIRGRNAILFVGAGVSMTVGLPSWNTLIEHMADELEIALDSAEGQPINYFTLAEYYRLRKGSIGPLRSWMDRHWSVPEKMLKQSRVHELIVELDFPILYTTNFDRNLETAFELRGKSFVKIVDAKDIARASARERRRSSNCMAISMTMTRSFWLKPIILIAFRSSRRSILSSAPMRSPRPSFSWATAFPT